jgi:ribosome-associated protein
VTESRDLARQAARAAASKQGDAIVILDVRDLITITDYFVIVSGSTDRQVRMIVDEVVRSLKDDGTRPVREEGEAATGWMLLDYVDFVVHVFRNEEREYYRLENLWRDAPVIEWQEDEQASSG